MKTYALKFEVEPPPSVSDLEVSFYDHFDGLISEAFGRLLITVYIDDQRNGIVAAKHAAVEIEKKLQVAALRIDRDLVDSAEIARRIGRSRENVRQLVHGERRRGAPFPVPAGAPNGKRIWEWHAVNEWLRLNVPEACDPEFGLTREEMTIVDNWLLRWRTLSVEQHVSLEFFEVTGPSSLNRTHARSNSTHRAWLSSWGGNDRVSRESTLLPSSD
ncbi:hypothetical protein ACFCYI_15080 [Streptomyces sp. NPDC056257]|uniref:hypothetical protein n=1 Tax=Streptomyces sp. NPDC056257 TaxID=3345765 RepID=UPI0035DD6161